MCLVLFLAALDQTIIATALPTIAGQFNASPAQFSWVVTVSHVASDPGGRRAEPFCGLELDSASRPKWLGAAPAQLNSPQPDRQH